MPALTPPITLPVNKFLGTLTNIIAYSQIADTLDDGSIVSQFVASCEDINIDYGMGKLIQYSDVMEVTDLPTQSTVLTTKKPTVGEQLIPIEEYKVVQMTINRYLMRGAFGDETAMANFIAYLFHAMNMTKRIYLFNQLIAQYEVYTPTQDAQTVTVDLIDVTKLTDPTQIKAARQLNSDNIYEALINTLTAMGADSDEFNDIGITEVIDYSKLKFVGNSYFNTKMTINTLATLLNSDLITDAQKWGETYILPYQKLSQDNQNKVIGWLGHRKKIQFGYFYNVATEFFDPSTLNQNNWLHFSYYMGEVEAYPMVKFVANYVTTGA